ncbi:hypothetical protein Tco_0685777, partial [Tanacetum coccineum]
IILVSEDALVFIAEKEESRSPESLREILEEEARDEKEREEKIRQKQEYDEEFMLKFGVKYDSEYDLNNENDQWELGLDIDDFDLRLTHVMRPSSSTRVETSLLTQNPVRIIPGPTGIVQAANLKNENDQWELSLDIDYSDLRLTLVMRPSSSTC